MTDETPTSADASEPAPEKPKSKFDTLLTSTPVLLTVVATLLAGLSSSEMTKAQYHRSLAAQNQSKAGDQWNFFQAKRIRGTNMDTSADVIAALAEPGTIDLDRMRRFTTQLAEELAQAQQSSGKLTGLVKADTPAPLKKSIEELQKAATQAASRSRALQDHLVGDLLKEKGTAEAFAALAAAKVPVVVDTPVADKAIAEALEQIRSRKTEKQTESLMRNITDSAVHNAIETAEDNARRFDKECAPIVKLASRVVLDLSEQVRFTRSYSRSVRDFSQSVPEETGKAPVELRSAATEMTRAAERNKTTASELFADVISARHHFNSRRYEREAEYNANTAALYEVQVRKSSWNSERHLFRSGLFFFGMLAAQAGVTVATLALAVRMRSLLWAIASIAGLAAIITAVVVYLFV